MTTTPIRKCPDCQVGPGQPHEKDCDVQICSSCGIQRLQCDCEDHDPAFARWSGFWPGRLEADALGVDLNTLHALGVAALLFIKPRVLSE